MALPTFAMGSYGLLLKSTPELFETMDAALTIAAFRWPHELHRRRELLLQRMGVPPSHADESSPTSVLSAAQEKRMTPLTVTPEIRDRQPPEKGKVLDLNGNRVNPSKLTIKLKIIPSKEVASKPKPPKSSDGGARGLGFANDSVPLPPPPPPQSSTKVIPKPKPPKSSDGGARDLGFANDSVPLPPPPPPQSSTKVISKPPKSSGEGSRILGFANDSVPLPPPPSQSSTELVSKPKPPNSSGRVLGFADEYMPPPPPQSSIEPPSKEQKPDSSSSSLDRVGSNSQGFSTEKPKSSCDARSNRKESLSIDHRHHNQQQGRRQSDRDRDYGGNRKYDQETRRQYGYYDRSRKYDLERRRGYYDIRRRRDDYDEERRHGYYDCRNKRSDYNEEERRHGSYERSKRKYDDERRYGDEDCRHGQRRGQEEDDQSRKKQRLMKEVAVKNHGVSRKYSISRMLCIENNMPEQYRSCKFELEADLIKS